MTPVVDEGQVGAEHLAHRLVQGEGSLDDQAEHGEGGHALGAAGRPEPGGGGHGDGVAPVGQAERGVHHRRPGAAAARTTPENPVAATTASTPEAREEGGFATTET